MGALNILFRCSNPKCWEFQPEFCFGIHFRHLSVILHLVFRSELDYSRTTVALFTCVVRRQINIPRPLFNIPRTARRLPACPPECYVCGCWLILSPFTMVLFRSDGRVIMASGRLRRTTAPSALQSIPRWVFSKVFRRESCSTCIVHSTQRLVRTFFTFGMGSKLFGEEYTKSPGVQRLTVVSQKSLY